MEKKMINKDPKKKEEVVKYPELAGLKKAHGEISIITIDDDYCFLKNPDRKTIGECFMYISGDKQDIIAAGEIILRRCFVGGSDKFLTDDSYIVSAAMKSFELIKIKEAELVKK